MHKGNSHKYGGRMLKKAGQNNDARKAPSGSAGFML